MKIYVVGSSKNKFFKLDNIREKFLIDEKHDGDNIDSLNPWYCELTGLYYLWKHVDDQIVGLEHYRRYFCSNTNKLLSEHEISNILTTSDIICVKSQYSKRVPVKTWLIRNRKMHDVLKFLTFAKVYVGEEYYNNCWNMLNSDWHCLGNMFVAKKELIDEYCEFIFDVTNTYRLAEKFYNRELPKRILGYFTEFLFGAYLVWKAKKIRFVKMRLVK